MTPTTTFKIEADSRGVRWLHIIERGLFACDTCEEGAMQSASRIKADAITRIKGIRHLDEIECCLIVSVGGEVGADSIELPLECDAPDLATDLWLAITGMSGPTFERTIAWEQEPYDAGPAAAGETIVPLPQPFSYKGARPDA